VSAGLSDRPTRETGGEPLAVAGSRVAAAVLALSLAGLGVLAGREALAGWGAVQGGSWVPQVADAVGSVGPQWWVLPAGVVLALVGLALVVGALRPRRRRHVALGGDGLVWVHARDLARLVRASVADVPGVLDVHVRGRRRTLRLDVVTTAQDTAPVREQVTDLVSTLVQDARPQPRVRVRVRTGGSR
jgi:hypothetical protein